jgi:hypothetical protein
MGSHVSAFEAATDMSWKEAMDKGQGTSFSPGSVHLFAGILMRLAEEHGDTPFLQRLFTKEIPAMSDISSESQALEEIANACSRAAGRELRAEIIRRWRWPLNASDRPAVALPPGHATWTDTKDRKITATFKAIASGNVLLDIAGKVTPVPLNTLSAESQKLARDYQQQAAPAESDAASRLRELTKPKTADPSSLEQSILGLWWESFDGKDIPFYPLAFFADGTAGFGKYDSVPPINGKWTITGEKLALTWANGCVYNIDLSKGTETRRTGQCFGGDDPNAEFSIKMVHTGVRPSASAVTHEDFAGQTFDFRYGDRFGDQGKDNSNGTIQLLYDGGVIQRSPMPITSWRVANGFVMFLDSRHHCLTLFGDLEKKDGKWHARGQYLPMAKVKHWLVPE